MAATLVLTSAIALALVFLPAEEYVRIVLYWVESMGVWGPVLLAGAYVLTCVLMIPGTPLSLAAGILFGVGVGTLVIWGGATAGCSVAFLLGRTLFREWVEHWLGKNRRLAALDRASREEGFRVVLLCRLPPFFPFVVLNYAFALTRIRFRDYLLASWLGMLPSTFLFVYVGAAARDLSHIFSSDLGGEEHRLNRILFGIGLGLTMVVTLVITRIASRMLHASVREG